jgi:hypothetical protein
MTFDDLAARWKRDTLPAYTLLFDMEERAQDNGLTAEEQREYEELKKFTNNRLVRFLRESREIQIK